jgi:RNA polymerase sigma-70 factor (ECF subfamily)
MAILNRKVADFYRKKYKSEPHVRLDHFFDETGSWKSNDVLKNWDASDTGDELLDNTDFNKTLEECMEELPARWKILLKMYYIEEKKHPK